MILGEEEREQRKKERQRQREEKMVIPQFIALKTYLALLPSTIAFFFFVETNRFLMALPE